MSAPNNGGYKALCPACGNRMRIRNSEAQTPTFKTMYAQCTNIACGATYTGSLTWDYALSPSGLDQPRVVLPIAPSTYYEHLAKRADPTRLSDRARRDEALRPEILRVFEEN